MKYTKSSIIFDVDSTLVTIEGIDYLAKQKDKKRQISQLTYQAMNGLVSMKIAMRLKLDLLKPNRKEIDKLGFAYINHLTPGAREAVANLQEAGHKLWLISGGLDPAIKLLGQYLNISPDQIFANQVFFDQSGKYCGFDESHPLANNHGKATLITTLKDKLVDPIVIGDGLTDLETKPVVHKFIGFGGVVIREIVRKQADHFITDLSWKTLHPIFSTLKVAELPKPSPQPPQIEPHTPSPDASPTTRA